MQIDELSLQEKLVTPGVYSTVITPEDAAYLLTLNSRNRNPVRGAIERYAQQMRDGMWHLTNQGIGVSSTLELLDGQNRCLASVAADAPFPTLLITGLEPVARQVVDVGVKRTAAHALTMAGHVNTAALAAGAAARLRYEELVAKGGPWAIGGQGWAGGRTKQFRSHEELVNYIADHPSLVDQTAHVWRWRGVLRKMPQASAVSFDSLLSEHNPDPWAEFRETVLSGAMLSEGDPRLHLRNIMMRQTKSPNSLWALGLMIKAYNLWRRGDTREVLVFKDAEPMPLIEAEHKRVRRTR